MRRSPPEKDRPAGQGRARSNNTKEHEMRSSEVYQDCLEEALLALSLGISVLPPKEDGSKSPLAEPMQTIIEIPQS
jgi:hypothetical protein